MLSPTALVLLSGTCKLGAKQNRCHWQRGGMMPLRVPLLCLNLFNPTVC